MLPVAMIVALAGAVVLVACADPPAPTFPPAPTIAASGVPAGWTAVTDAATGVRAELPGPARRAEETVAAPQREDKGVAYHALDPTGRVEAVLHLSPLPAEDRVDPQETATRTAHLVNGELVESRPVRVAGHAAVDARINQWPRAGGSGRGILLVRIIDTPRFEVTVETNGDTEDAALIQRVFDQVCAGLRLP